ncbi:MAG TPA: glycosyltransferase family A protein [Egibacteraceae bacterium]|nr:glycosyltransferase family A protein [Egibacteraceae bacterium]
MTTDRPRVVVVVPCRNERATVARCVASLLAQEPAPDQVIVVDGGSTDGSAELARAAGAEVVHHAGGTIAARRNAGVRAAGDAEVVGFLDADCEAHPGWLAAGLAALRDADAVGNRLRAPDGAPWVARRWSALESRLARTDSPLWSANLMVLREPFDTVGGFTESRRTAEDVDLSHKLRAAGARLARAPGMGATHHGFPGTLAAFVRRERWHASTPGWWAATSPRGRALVATAGAWLVVGAAAGGSAARRCSLRPAAAWLAASGAGVVALGAAAKGGRHAPADGAVLSAWALARLTRLATGLHRP